MHRPLLALSMLAALGGCDLAPRYHRPVAPIAAAYPSPVPPGRAGAAPSAASLGWRDFFLDPRLRALVAAALTNNRDLAQSIARIAQARAQYRIRAADRLPTIALNGGGTRTRQPLSALGAVSAVPGVDGGPSGIVYDQFTANVGVSAFELDLWGRVRNLAEAERARYLASIEGARAYRLTLIADVAATYFSIRSGEERIALAEQTLSGRRASVELARKRLDAGVTSTVDYDQSVLLLTQAATELADLQRTTEQSRNMLDVLVGGPIAGPLPEERALAPAAQVRGIAPGLPSALLADRPDVRQAEYALRAANADIGAARAAFFPNIALTGAYGFASAALGDLFRSGNIAWSIGSALNLPIFDWGRRSAQVRLSRAQADELAAAYQRSVQGAFREVADALVARRRYAEQIVAQTRTVEAQRRLARTAQLRYENGIAIYLEVLDAQRNQFSAEQQLISLRSAELQNAVSLYTSLGGGVDPDAIDPVAGKAIGAR